MRLQSQHKMIVVLLGISQRSSSSTWENLEQVQCVMRSALGDLFFHIYVSYMWKKSCEEKLSLGYVMSSKMSFALACSKVVVEFTSYSSVFFFTFSVIACIRINIDLFTYKKEEITFLFHSHIFLCSCQGFQMETGKPCF